MSPEQNNIPKNSGACNYNTGVRLNAPSFSPNVSEHARLAMHRDPVQRRGLQNRECTEIASDEQVRSKRTANVRSQEQKKLIDESTLPGDVKIAYRWMQDREIAQWIDDIYKKIPHYDIHYNEEDIKLKIACYLCRGINQSTIVEALKVYQQFCLYSQYDVIPKNKEQLDQYLKITMKSPVADKNAYIDEMLAYASIQKELENNQYYNDPMKMLEIFVSTRQSLNHYSRQIMIDALFPSETSGNKKRDFKREKKILQRIKYEKLTHIYKKYNTLDRIKDAIEYIERSLDTIRDNHGEMINEYTKKIILYIEDKMSEALSQMMFDTQNRGGYSIYPLSNSVLNNPHVKNKISTLMTSATLKVNCDPITSFDMHEFLINFLNTNFGTIEDFEKMLFKKVQSFDSQSFDVSHPIFNENEEEELIHLYLEKGISEKEIKMAFVKQYFVVKELKNNNFVVDKEKMISEYVSQGYSLIDATDRANKQAELFLFAQEVQYDPIKILRKDRQLFPNRMDPILLLEEDTSDFFEETSDTFTENALISEKASCQPRIQLVNEKTSGVFQSESHIDDQNVCESTPASHSSESVGDHQDVFSQQDIKEKSMHRQYESDSSSRSSMKKILDLAKEQDISKEQIDQYLTQGYSEDVVFKALTVNKNFRIFERKGFLSQDRNDIQILRMHFKMEGMTDDDIDLYFFNTEKMVQNAIDSDCDPIKMFIKKRNYPSHLTPIQISYLEDKLYGPGELFFKNGQFSKNMMREHGAHNPFQEDQHQKESTNHRIEYRGKLLDQTLITKYLNQNYDMDTIITALKEHHDFLNEKKNGWWLQTDEDIMFLQNHLKKIGYTEDEIEQCIQAKLDFVCNAAKENFDAMKMYQKRHDPENNLDEILSVSPINIDGIISRYVNPFLSSDTKFSVKSPVLINSYVGMGYPIDLVKKALCERAIFITAINEGIIAPNEREDKPNIQKLEQQGMSYSDAKAVVYRLKSFREYSTEVNRDAIKMYFKRHHNERDPVHVEHDPHHEEHDLDHETSTTLQREGIAKKELSDSSTINMSDSRLNKLFHLENVRNTQYPENYHVLASREKMEFLAELSDENTMWPISPEREAELTVFLKDRGYSDDEITRKIDARKDFLQYAESVSYDEMKMYEKRWNDEKLDELLSISIFSIDEVLLRWIPRVLKNYSNTRLMEKYLQEGYSQDLIQKAFDERNHVLSIWQERLISIDKNMNDIIIQSLVEKVGTISGAKGIVYKGKAYLEYAMEVNFDAIKMYFKRHYNERDPVHVEHDPHHAEHDLDNETSTSSQKEIIAKQALLDGMGVDLEKGVSKTPMTKFLLDHLSDSVNISDHPLHKWKELQNGQYKVILSEALLRQQNSIVSHSLSELKRQAILAGFAHDILQGHDSIRFFLSSEQMVLDGSSARCSMRPLSLCYQRVCISIMNENAAKNLLDFCFQKEKSLCSSDVSSGSSKCKKSPYSKILVAFEQLSGSSIKAISVNEKFALSPVEKTPITIFVRNIPDMAEQMMSYYQRDTIPANYSVLSINNNQVVFYNFVNTTSVDSHHCSRVSTDHDSDDMTKTRLPIQRIDIGGISSLKYLPHLTMVDLSGNNLHSVPAIGSRKLTHLSLSYNRIKRIEGDEFNGNRLEVLDLSHNELTSFPRLKADYLHKLLLSNNQIHDGNIVQCLYELPKLKWLDLSKNKLSDVPFPIENIGRIDVILGVFSYQRDLKDHIKTHDATIYSLPLNRFGSCPLWDVQGATVEEENCSGINGISDANFLQFLGLTEEERKEKSDFYNWLEKNNMVAINLMKNKGLPIFNIYYYAYDLKQ